ncbi:MAG TPA: DUF4296 domain-containing protein [Bacteroidales bacterium]|nr:DUF4296 domain-containing protein [Bacteroidales bacterium]
MKNRSFPLFLMILLLASCSTRKNEIDRSELIPEDKLTEILTDLYLTDGLLSLPAVHTWYNPADSLSSYSDVITDHGYTKDLFDKTMRFYFIKRPKKLIKIYDVVLARLSEMESRTAQELSRNQSGFSYLWKGRDYYAFPGDNDTTLFDIEFPYPGSFKISFTVTLYHDDQSVNPGFFAYLSSKDSIDTGRRTYISPIGYIKDDLPHRYTYQIDAPDPARLHVRGWLFSYDNARDWDKKHYFIDNISVASAAAEQ